MLAHRNTFCLYIFLVFSFSDMMVYDRTNIGLRIHTMKLMAFEFYKGFVQVGSKLKYGPLDVYLTNGRTMYYERYSLYIFTTLWS